MAIKRNPASKNSARRNVKHSDATKPLETLPWREAMARMFPHAAERVRATGEWPRVDEFPWKPWTPLHPELQVDKVVRTLIQRRDNCVPGHKLRSDAEIMEQGLFRCPYYFARLTTVIAAFEAAKAAERETNFLIKYRESKEIEAQLNDLEKQTESLLKEPRLTSIINWHSRGDAQVNVEARMLAAINVRDALALVREGKRGLTELSHIAAQERRQWSKPNKTSDVWGQTFAQVMARCWYNLTGSNPSRNIGALFQTFLENAAADLLGDGETPPFDRFLSVTEALHRQASNPDGGLDARPWDGLDRDVKGLRAPGSIEERSYLKTDESRDQGRRALIELGERIIHNQMDLQSLSAVESQLVAIGAELVSCNEDFRNHNTLLSLFGLMARRIDQFNQLEETEYKNGLPLSSEIKEELRYHDFMRKCIDPVSCALSAFYIDLYYSSKNQGIREYIDDITGGYRIDADPALATSGVNSFIAASDATAK